MEFHDPEPIPDPLSTPVGRFAHSILTALETVIGNHAVILILVDPVEDAIAIESGGFDEPAEAIAAVEFAAKYMAAFAPTDVTGTPPMEV